MSDADDDDEPLTLGSDALLALQSVLSPSGGTGDDTTLIQLLQARRMEDDTDDDDSSNNNYEDDGGLSSGESHLEYYKKLYPERYGTSETGGLEEGDGKLVAIVSMDDEYIRKLILTAFEKRPKWKVLTEVPTHVDTVVENSNNRETTNLEYHFHWGEYEHIGKNIWCIMLIKSESILLLLLLSLYLYKRLVFGQFYSRKKNCKLLLQSKGVNKEGTFSTHFGKMVCKIQRH